MHPTQRRIWRQRLRHQRKVMAARTVLPEPRARLLRLMAELYPTFESDGCTAAPDSWFGFDISWACQIHDLSYCAQARPPSQFGQLDRLRHDFQLHRDVRHALPIWFAGWVPRIYLDAVTQFGAMFYASCEPGDRPGGQCKHGLTERAWEHLTSNQLAQLLQEF